MRPERFHRLVQVLSRRQPDLTVLMEMVNKPHNFSAILRSCDAVGVLEAHVVWPETELEVELHHATSAGTRKWVRVTPHPDVGRAVAHLRARGFRIVAAHPSAEARDYRDVDFTRPTALLLGAELLGVSREALAAADEHVVIPMLGMVHSLNVSVAAALLLYEAQRQRAAAGMYERCRLEPETFRRTLFGWAHPLIAAKLDAAGSPYPSLDDDGEIVQR